MYSNPFVDQLLAEERMKDAIRRNEQTRLIRMAEDSGQPQRWRLSMIFARKNSLALFKQPQHKRLTANTPNL
jgi:hypothetical protein